MKTVLLALSILLFCTSVFADYQKGKDAYDRGDFKYAFKEWKALADKGIAGAQYDVGLLYERGEGVTKNYKSALKWYRLSADKGNNSAQYKLGAVYYNGMLGLSQDYQTALKWFTLAGEQGNAMAQYALGLMYEKGRGVSPDYKAALKWYRLSAEQGYAFAQTNLGSLYANGKGVKRDYIQAHLWWHLADLLGNKVATDNLVDLQKRMSSAEISRAQDLALKCESRNYKGCFPENAMVCSNSEEVNPTSKEKVAAFIISRISFLESLGTTYDADVFDQFVIEARKILKTSTIVKTEFSSKLLRDGETKAKYFKRTGCDTYLQLSVASGRLTSQVIAGGTLGEERQQLRIKITGEMIRATDNSTIWKKSYSHTCGFYLPTLSEMADLMFNEKESNEVEAKKSKCGKQAGKAIAHFLPN